VDLHHCKDPVNYHIFFKDHGLGVHNFTLKKGDAQPLFKTKFGTVTIRVTQLERKDNIVTTSVRAMNLSSVKCLHFLFKICCCLCC